VLTDAVRDLIALVLGTKSAIAPHDNPWKIQAGVTVNITPPPGDPDRFLPTRSTLEATLGGLAAAAREQAVRDRLAVVAKSWTTLAARPSTQGQTARLRQARQVAAAMPAQPSPLAAFVPPDLALWLRLDETPGTLAGTGEQVGNDAAWSLVSAQAANPVNPVDVSAHVGTAAAAANILVQLRRVNDIIDRFDAACRGWEDARGRLATVLALYRTEGDMLIPPSRQSLAGTDVPVAGGVRVGLPSGRTNFGGAIPQLAFRPDVSHAIYVADQAKAKANGYELNRVLDLASFSFWVMVAGLDDMFTQGSGRGSTVKEWLALNHPELLPDEAAKVAWDAYSLSYRTLDREVRSGCEVVTSDDPVLLVKNILAEGVRHMRIVGTLEEVLGGPGVSGPLPDLLQYLRFHAGKDQFQAIALSALVAARASGTVHAHPLRAAINASDAATKHALSTTGATTAATVALATAHWVPFITPFLRRPAMLDALDTFIARAGDGEWGSWKDHRSNAMRYDRLLRYYRTLFPLAMRL
jgi:hypothetical protein